MFTYGKTKTAQLTATISPSTVENKNITWSSSNPSVATVNENGKVTAVKGGTSVITAKSDNNKKATYAIKVYDEPTFKITNNNIDNGSIVLLGNTCKIYIDIIADKNYIVDTSKINFKEPDKITSSGAVATTTSIAGGAKFDNKTISYNGNGKVEISFKNSTEGYVIFDIGEGFIKYNNQSNVAKRKTYYVASLNISTSEKYDNNEKEDITAIVGVHNSFYIDNYKFGQIDVQYNKTNEFDSIDSITTNEHTYTGVPSTTKHIVSAKIIVNIDRGDNNYKIEGIISKAFESEQFNSEVEIYYIDVNHVTDQKMQGDCIFIRAKDSNGNYKTMLVDMGHDSDIPAKRINSLLKKLNVSQIDYLLVTHFHGDHCGGYNRLKSNNYTINNYIFSCNYDKKDKSDVVVDVQKNHIKKLKTVTAGNCIKLGNALINIYMPYPYENVPKNWLSSDDKDSTNNTRASSTDWKNAGFYTLARWFSKNLTYRR